MNVTKLTLSLDKKTIESAKKYGTRHKISLSKMVGRYFESLAGPEERFPPVVSRLLGILPPKASPEEHKRYLAKKHRL